MSQQPKVVEDVEGDELPTKLKIENLWLAAGSTISLALTPIFIYNCSKKARAARIVFPHTMLITNHLEGDSLADIMFNALWQYGIPTQVTMMQWDKEYGRLVMKCGFFVPHTRAWEADIYLRQWSKGTGLSYSVDSPVQYSKGHSSLEYSDRLYRPKGVMAKNHSFDMMVGNMLFGHRLKTCKATYSKKKDELKTEESSPKILSQYPKQREATPKQRKAKLGKTYG